MSWFATRRERAMLVGLACAAVSGCASPPSVVPLLRATESVLREESARALAEVEREAAAADAARRTIDAGFDADLAGREPLTAAWVRDAATVYALAREEVLRHELAAAAAHRSRAADLGAAAFATRRAIELIERQDRLILGATRVDLWRLLRGDTDTIGGER